jgi:hypothetical protein
VGIRYFPDGTFWIAVGTDPAETKKMRVLFDAIKELTNKEK